MRFARAVVMASTIFLVPVLPALAQNLKPWRYGIVDPKGDAGFQFMVGHGDFAARRGLKIETVPMRDGAIAHKALLSANSTASGRARAKPSSRARAAPTSRSSAATGPSSRTA